MNKKKLQSYLSMSVIIGFFINFIFTLIIDTQSKELYNYLITGICSCVPLIIFVISVNIYLYNYRKLNIKRSIIFFLIYLIISFLTGFLIEYLIVDKFFNKDINNIVRMANALYQSTIGILVSIWFSYDYFKKIEK